MARKARLSMDANPGGALKTGWSEGSRRPGAPASRKDPDARRRRKDNQQIFLFVRSTN